MVVSLFFKNVYDEFFLSSIQIMFCKFFFNLVECIRVKSELENGNVSQGEKFRGKVEM